MDEDTGGITIRIPRPEDLPAVVAFCQEHGLVSLIDNTFLSRALQGDILEAYESPTLVDIPDDLELDPSHRLLPVDYGDVCLNYDKAWFDEQGLTPPANSIINAGLGAPDIHGSYGIFTFYTDSPSETSRSVPGGRIEKVPAQSRARTRRCSARGGWT